MIPVVDPGSRVSGVAIFDGGPPLVAAIKDHTPAIANKIIVWLYDHGARRLILEDQHAPRNPKAFNWPSLQRLLYAAHSWQVCAELHGMDVVLANPAMWQGPAFKSVAKVDERGKKLSTKQRSKIVARAGWDTVRRFVGLPDEWTEISTTKLTSDEADAIAIGRWWMLYGSRGR